MKTAIVTGATGQDASYLIELLLDKGYRVIGLTRRSSTDTTIRLGGCKGHKNFELVEADLIDPNSVNHIIRAYKPHEVYNLAAQSHVGSSFEQPIVTTQVNYLGVLYILEAIVHYCPECRFYQASTSEMFGSNVGPQGMQNEDTPFAPNSPYAVAKTAAHHAVRNYRTNGLHASCGILFNHESERRGSNFVTKKISEYVADIGYNRPHQSPLEAIRDNIPKLKLGNIDASRDWGHAEDYVYGMWLMLQQDKPDDYILATSETHTVKEFLIEAFQTIGIEDWYNYVEHNDNSLLRKVEVPYLCGDYSKAAKVLGWRPKITFHELVRRMVEYDIQEAA